MQRALLGADRIHPAVRKRWSAWNEDIVTEVSSAIAAHDIVVVGMAQNPHCRKAKRLLREQNLPFFDLEYGSYLSQWRRRSALKMWSGWPTFPMVFVRGTLVGGASDLAALVAAGELASLLEKSPAGA